MMGVAEDADLDTVRTEIEKFRELYKNWVSRFEKDEFEDEFEDEWGLF